MFSENLMQTYAPSKLSFEQGSGTWLYTKSGEAYLDFASGIAVNILGHSHPHLVSKIQLQASKLLHTSNLYNIEQQQRLAKRLCSLSFAEKVFFCNSGAEANEGAIKVARRYMHSIGQPKRNVIICIEGCFHGRTLAMLAATSKKENRVGFGPLPKGFRHVTFGDIDALEKNIDSNVAAIIIEPVQGEGGVNSLPLNYLEQIQNLANKNKFLVISDEVQTGMGRLGRMFGYQDTALKPDIMALAKGLGGGVPLGAVLASQEVAKGMTPGSHGSTFGGNPLVMAAGNAVLDIITEKDFMKKAQMKMEHLSKGLKILKKKFASLIEEIRGEGFLRGLKVKFPVKDLVDSMNQRKILTVPAADNVLRLIPPLTVKINEINIVLYELEFVLKNLQRKSK